MVQQTQEITQKKKGGWAGKLKPDEHKVKVYAYVMQKHYKKAQQEVTEHCKQYR